jgi:hypothetical protein
LVLSANGDSPLSADVSFRHERRWCTAEEESYAQELGDDQVRVTTRLPRALYAELEAIGREHWTVRGTSELIRHALLHYLDCPDRHLATIEREAYKQWLIDHHLP